MAQCRICHHPNPEGSRVCLNCSAALESTCPACGAPAPAGARFCGQCGARLPQLQPPLVGSPRREETQRRLRALMPSALADKVDAASADIFGERREVTVVFADIDNFTAYAHTMDSEDVFVIMDEAMHLFTEVIYEYEGTVDKFTGDGLMALFGAPVAHENDPERAVRAALQLHTVLRPLQERVRKENGFELRLRTGVNTGPVIAGQVGSDLHMEYTVIGDTVNLAQRLEAAAQLGTVLVSFTTYQRTRPVFEYRTLPPTTVKGVADPLRVYQPLGLQAKPGRVRGLPGLQVPIVGREDALANLRETWADICRDRACRIVSITGEAGLGKSRVVAEFRRSLSDADARVYQGSCLAYARSKPFWIMAELARDIAHVSEVDPESVQRQRLREHLDRLGIGDEALPYLLNVLQLQHTGPAIESPWRLLDAATLRQQTHLALRQFLLAEAHLTPTILVFEDLHWIDSASRDFLEYLITTTDDLPLMILLIARATADDTTLALLMADAEAHPRRLSRIPLQPLSSVEGRLLVDHLLQPMDETPADLKDAIATRAEGNPFYTEEIVRMLIDQGALTEAHGAWQMSSDAPVLLEEVPGTLKGLVLARFDNLPANLRRTAQRAAVLGRSFPVDLLAELEGMSAEATAARLAELEARGLFALTSFGEQQGCSFCHPLVQEAIYGTLLKRHRRELHEEVARAIESGGFWPAEERSDVLAHHFVRSAQRSRAIPYLISSAQSAMRRGAIETAIQQYRQALDLLSEAPQRDDQEFFRVQIGLAEVHKFAGRFGEACQVLQDAIHDLRGGVERSPNLLPFLVSALRELGDTRHREGALDEAIGHLEDSLMTLGEKGRHEQPDLWRSVMDRLAWVKFRQGSVDEALALATLATSGAAVPGGGDPVTLASLYNTLGGIAYQRNNLPQAIAHVEQSLALYESLGYSWGMANCFTNAGILQYLSGKWPEAASSFERSDSIRRKIGYMPGLAVNLKNLGLLRMAMGDHSRALRHLEDSLSISQSLRDDYGIVCAQIDLAHLAVVQGRLEAATALLKSARGLLDAAGQDEAIQARWLWALVQAGKGDLAAALNTAEAALEMARSAGVAEAETDCLRALGILRARAGQYETAAALLEASADLGRQRNDPYREGLALVELGAVGERQSPTADASGTARRAQAMESLQQAIDRFERLGAAYDLRKAQVILNRLSSGLAPDASEAEWRPAAVLWLSLRPPLGADDEATFETISFMLPRLEAIAQEQRAQFIRRPKGLTVVFGVPRARRDDVARAVQAAWRMLECLREEGASAGLPLMAGLSVSYGDVIVGRIGVGAQTELVVTGQPVQVAQLAAQAAPAGAILVTEPVRAATEPSFVYEASRASVSTPWAEVPVWELSGPRRQQAPSASSAHDSAQP
jgi:class 3 adenylate cyclase